MIDGGKLRRDLGRAPHLGEGDFGTLHTRPYTIPLANMSDMKTQPDIEANRRPCRAIHTNSAEGYFSIFKRGMRGVYQHCKEKHLHRYLAEFDQRYNSPRRARLQRHRPHPRRDQRCRRQRLTYRQPRI
jgi:hypothetical protein